MAAWRRWGVLVVCLGVLMSWSGAPNGPTTATAAAAPGAPNIFIYNLDDLRDAFPGGIDPLQYMPKTRQWMAAGTRYSNMFVTVPSCCPSRSALMTGRYSHNNGVTNQSEGPKFPSANSMACYLKNNGYSTYEDGKFLTSWPKTQRPPCFDHSTVMWAGYSNVDMRVDGVAKKTTGYAATILGTRGREYITQALKLGKPFLLYETPQTPHWIDTVVNGKSVRLAVPDTKYAKAAIAKCSGIVETDRSDKPAYVRNQNHTAAQAQQMCESQMRAIMTTDDEFGATMQLLSDRGVLDNTLVIFTSDNGYMWGEHSRTEKFVPYEPSMRVPLLVRWPAGFTAGTNTTRLVSYLDLLPTLLQAAGIVLPATAPKMDGESLLLPSARTVIYGEYWADPANGLKNGVPVVDTWKMVRRGSIKYIQTYNATGAVIFREYYNLANDPAENTNLLGDASTANDPPAAEIAELTALLNAMATCVGAACVR